MENPMGKASIVGLPPVPNWKAEKTNPLPAKEKFYMLTSQPAFFLGKASSSASLASSSSAGRRTLTPLPRRQPSAAASSARGTSKRRTRPPALAAALPPPPPPPPPPCLRDASPADEAEAEGAPLRLPPPPPPPLFAEGESSWAQRHAALENALPLSAADARAVRRAARALLDDFEQACAAGVRRLLAEASPPPARRVADGVLYTVCAAGSGVYRRELAVLRAATALPGLPAHAPLLVRATHRGYDVWCTALHPPVLRREPLAAYLRLPGSHGGGGGAAAGSDAAHFLAAAEAAVVAGGCAYLLDLSPAAFPFASLREAAEAAAVPAAPQPAEAEPSPAATRAGAEAMRQQMRRLGYAAESRAAWELLLLHDAARRSGTLREELLPEAASAALRAEGLTLRAGAAATAALLERRLEWLAARPTSEGARAQWRQADAEGALRLLRTEVAADAFAGVFHRWCRGLGAPCVADVKALALAALNGLVNKGAEMHAAVWEQELPAALRASGWVEDAAVLEAGVCRHHLFGRGLSLLGVSLSQCWTGASNWLSPALARQLQPSDVELRVVLERGRASPPPDPPDAAAAADASTSKLGRACEGCLAAVGATYGEESLAKVPTLLRFIHAYTDMASVGGTGGTAELTCAENLWKKLLGLHIGCVERLCPAGGRRPPGDVGSEGGGVEGEGKEEEEEDVVAVEIPPLAAAPVRVRCGAEAGRLLAALGAVGAWYERVGEYEKARAAAEAVRRVACAADRSAEARVAAVEARLAFAVRRRVAGDAVAAYQELAGLLAARDGPRSRACMRQQERLAEFLAAAHDGRSAVPVLAELAEKAWALGRPAKAEAHLKRALELHEGGGGSGGAAAAAALARLRLALRLAKVQYARRSFAAAYDAAAAVAEELRSYEMPLLRTGEGEGGGCGDAEKEAAVRETALREATLIRDVSLDMLARPSGQRVPSLPPFEEEAEASVAEEEERSTKGEDAVC